MRGPAPLAGTVEHVTLDTSAPHFAAMADRLLPQSGPSIGHGDKVRVPPRIWHVFMGGSRFASTVKHVTLAALDVRSYVNLHAIRAPMLHSPERGGGSDNCPRLSLGNGATFGPKVTCFTVYFLAGSHRSRAAAPDLYESSIVLRFPAEK